MEKHPFLTDDDLVFTGPLSISRTDAAVVRERLVQFIKELGNIIKTSPGEELRCLNLDFVKIIGSQM